MKNLNHKLQLSPSLEKEPLCHDLNRSSTQDRQDDALTGPRKYWEVSAHCEVKRFPQQRPQIAFDNFATNYHYNRLATSSTKHELHVVKQITQAHFHALGRLNKSQAQVRNFILPVQLIKMKNMDPLSRQKITEDLCKYFSCQQGLCNIVLEQAELTFQDLCRLLVAIAKSPKVKSLDLWHVLKPCAKPFEGPLQSDINLNDLPRLPYTVNPGGRKYLRELKNNSTSIQGSRHSQASEHSPDIQKEESGFFLRSYISQLSCRSRKISPDGDSSRILSKNIDSPPASKDIIILPLSHSKDIVRKIEKYESAVVKCLTESEWPNNDCKLVRKEFVQPRDSESKDHVCLQTDVGIQCDLSQDPDYKPTTSKEASRTHRLSAEESRVDMPTAQKAHIVKNARLQFCERYLKLYENSYIDLETLQTIYIIALNSLTNLTQLAVNYSMLADGTGAALMSIGSIARGKLKRLRLLCEPDDMPHNNHQLYNSNAIHAIPDLIWHSVRKSCPHLGVQVVCVSMSAYSVFKRFVTRSMPLASFHMENGFCPTLVSKQLLLFSTLKCLWLDHAETLEHVNLTFWHSTGRIDSTLEKLVQNTQLYSFAYHGPLQYKATINKMCDAALVSPRLKSFKLRVQGDPCFPHIASELTSNLYDEYRHQFQEKNINFVLGTFNS